MKYRVYFNETIRHALEVEAKDENEAYEKASDVFYDTGEETKDVTFFNKETIDNEYTETEEVKK